MNDLILTQIAERLENGHNSLNLAEMNAISEVIREYTLIRNSGSTPTLQKEQEEEPVEEVPEEDNVENIDNADIYTEADKFDIKLPVGNDVKEPYTIPKGIKKSLVVFGIGLLLASVAVYFLRPEWLAMAMLPFGSSNSTIKQNDFVCNDNIFMQCGAGGPNYQGPLYSECCKSILNSNPVLCKGLSPDMSCSVFPTFQTVSFSVPKNVMSGLPPV